MNSEQTILIVEDDKMVRELIGIYLQKADYDVVEALDGVAAKDAFLTHHSCLIVFDLMLPKLSGEDFGLGFEIKNGMKYRLLCYLQNQEQKIRLMV